MKFTAVALAAVLAAATAVPASAVSNIGTYVLDYTGLTGAPLPATAHIRFTASLIVNGSGGYDILSASGTVNGDAITGLAPINPPGFNTDNIYFASDPIFSSNGLGVITTVGDANLWGNGPGSYSLYEYDGNGYNIATDGTLSVMAVPEAATWSMLIAGFGLVGFAARRRTASVAA